MRLRLACLALCACAALAQAAPASLDTMLRNADQRRWRDAAGQKEALALCQDVLAAPKINSQQKLRAYDILLDIHTRQRSYSNVVATSRALRQAFPADAGIARRAVFAEADAWWAWDRGNEDGIAVLTNFVAAAPGQPEAASQAWLRVGRFHNRAKRPDDALAAAERALAGDPENSMLAVEALHFMQDTAQRAGRPEARLSALRRLVEPRLHDAMRYADLTARREQCGQLLMQLGHRDEARAFLARLEVADTDPVNRQKWCYLLADSWLRQTNLVAAAAGFEAVITNHPSVRDRWPDAQERLVEILQAQGQADAALSAAKLAWAAARDGAATERILTRISAIWRAKLGPKAAEAEALTLLRRFGPGGRDGKIGTADDVKDPMAKIPYPDCRGRKSVFAAAPAAGDGMAAAYHRGWCAIYAADPEEALRHFAEALRRCTSDQFELVTQTVLRNGFRPLAGATASLEAVGLFLSYGPAGMDGEIGTPDDLADPFAAAGIAGAAPSGLSAADEARLAELQTRLAVLVDRSDVSQRRLDALRAYVRSCETRVTMDRAQALRWVNETLASEKDPAVASGLLRLAQTVAKSGDLHAAGIRAYWREVGELEARPKPFGDAWRAFDRSVRHLEPRKR